MHRTGINSWKLALCSDLKLSFSPRTFFFLSAFVPAFVPQDKLICKMTTSGQLINLTQAKASAGKSA